MIGFLFGLFFGGLVGFFTLAVCVAAQDKEPQPVERAYRDGYEQGLRDFAERAKKNASWPEWEEMHVEDIDDTLTEMLEEQEGRR